MANTRMSAKNGFLEGLILDLAPENMSANSMSAALNATLLTFNGNEMVLQNDMGNGRVETAYLPEGYIPVGTCEFGDIIYIVSYNPLLNKSLIGCFPSPERNISTEEIGGLGLILSWEDFQEGDSEPNGKLKASSVKKILYDNRDMTPGDKYIIYSEDLENNNLYLSDYGNTSHKHDTFPKLVKIHVVSIEESGKIVYLDSTTRWYDNIDRDYYLSDKGAKTDGKIDLDSYRDLLSSGYSIFSSKVSGKLALLVELEKITGFSCAWEAYSNSVINENNLESTDYSIYMHYNWTTEHNDINPDGVALLTSEWKDGNYYLWEEGDPLTLHYNDPKSGILIPSASLSTRYKHISRHYIPEDIGNNYDAYLKTNYESSIKEYEEAYKLNINKDNGIPVVGEYLINCTKVERTEDKKIIYYSGDSEIKPKNITDSIVNNYFHYPIIKHFHDFSIPTRLTITYKGETIYKEPDITNLIYHYKIAPTMPYGILEEYAQEGYIDFSKLGKKHINLNTWKYYNYENTSTLTWGMEAYTEPNKGIQEVVFEFYDNNGFVAAYHTKDKLSYNGVFTEYLTLNESGSNYKLNNIKAFGTNPTYHKGLEVTKETAVPGFMYLKDGDEDKYENWKTYDDISGQDSTKYYMDDSGTLYSNCLYLVKIIIKYCNKNILDEYLDLTDEEEAIVDYRWYWTNTMFNEYYYQELDFKNLLFTLNMDGNIIYNSNGWNIKKADYLNNSNGAINNTNSYKSLSATVLYVKDIINVSVQGGLLDDYGTFNLDVKTIENIDANIYLANLYIDNDPSKPNVIFSDLETEVDQIIYPINSETFNVSNTLSNISNSLNKLLETNILGSNTELWSDKDSYKKYENTYQLDLLLNSSEIPITYIDYKGDTTETKTTQYIKTLLDKLLYNSSEGIDINFSGIHFSKYYYHTKEETRVGKLRPFVLTLEDLKPYNIDYDRTFYHNKVLLFSNTDASGKCSIINGGICYFSSNKQCLDYDELLYVNSKGLNSNEGGGESDDIPASFFFDLNNREILDNFKFLFPVGFGGFSGDFSLDAKVGNMSISDNNPIEKKYYSNSELGGTLAGIFSTGAIELGDHYISKNSSNASILTRFIPYVMGYLTQSYYLDNSEYSVTVPGNYIYLDKNNSNYIRDIILELKPEVEFSENNNHNNLIRFKLFKNYSDYLNSITNLFKDVDFSKDPNVNLNLLGCLKNCPIIILFLYITPTMLYNFSNHIEVMSCFSSIPKIILGDFTPQLNTVYEWDFLSQQFNHVRNARQINIANYYLLDNNIVGEEGNNYQNVGNQLKKLSISNDNTLQFSNLPTLNTSNTYVINTSEKSSDISGLKTNLKYY